MFYREIDKNKVPTGRIVSIKNNHDICIISNDWALCTTDKEAKYWQPCQRIMPAEKEISGDIMTWQIAGKAYMGYHNDNTLKGEFPEIPEDVLFYRNDTLCGEYEGYYPIARVWKKV